jgi:hypothetical protein
VHFDRHTLRRISSRYGLTHVASRRDVERLRMQYVYDQFKFFGPEFQSPA